jgi:predicted nucleic acid-binding protein
MESTSLFPQNKKVIIIDTCVVQYLGKNNHPIAKVITDCLRLLKNEGFGLAISEITLVENLHGLWGDKEDKAFNLLLLYEWKRITQSVLTWAAWLGGLYHDEKIDGIDIGDKIIAATAVVETGFILTANHKDYPHPFFVTEKAFALPYKVGHFTKTIDVVLYKPNLELIMRRYTEKEMESRHKK